MKTDFNDLEMIYKATSSSEIKSCMPINCEKCVVLQNKVKYLLKIALKLSLGTANLNAILDSRNCDFNKVGFEYQGGFQRK